MARKFWKRAYAERDRREVLKSVFRDVDLQFLRISNGGITQWITDVGTMIEEGDLQRHRISEFGDGQ